MVDSQKIIAELEVHLEIREVETLNKMVIATRDVLDSQAFRDVFRSTVDIGFYLLYKRLEDCVQAVSKPEDRNDPQIRVPFAKLLPEIRKDLHEANRSVIDNADSSLLVQHFLCSEILGHFTSNIYEEFCNPSTSDAS